MSRVERAARFCGLPTMIAEVALLVAQILNLLLRVYRDVIPKLALQG
jgi:hypothetical protein